MTTSAKTKTAATELFRTPYGYFTPDGREYVITRPDTPRPWVNVISNGKYGLVISQTGGGFSWWENANLARLTHWSQDLVRDDWGKYLYLRDDETGEVWSASWKPLCARYDRYEVRHGMGYTTFTAEYRGIETQWTLFVPPEEALEIWMVRVRNTSEQPRKLSLLTYLEWALGNDLDWHREFQKTFIETTFDAPLNALIGLKRRIPIPAYISTGMNEISLAGFHAVNRPVASYEGDKDRFFGRYNNPATAAALKLPKLSNTVGRWHDSIASLHVQLTLQPRQTESVNFFVGKYDSREALETIIAKYRTAEAADEALRRVAQMWEPFLTRLRVETPDPAFNVMTNVWLKYQAISGRMWARTAYYQSSAAYGYRDQLQDSHIFLPLEPSLTRQQVRLHASHQYQDGAVQHWFFSLPPTGPRTNKTDDLLWLVFLTLNYILETDDLSILKDKAPFVDGGQGTILDHCTRSIEKVLTRFSKRGLPLIGEGDWNDGLSAAGAQWKGESVWLGHFFYAILERWSELLVRLKDTRRAKTYRARAAALKTAINQYGWDGKWYWYASRDDGQLIGSRKNQEGRIHLNAQTWSVIAGTAAPQRANTAMASMEQLLEREYGTLLLTPAYTQPDEHIGYLTRYAPGIRENGGVYSHGATWAVWAECLLGRAENAYRMYSKICPPKRGMDPELYVAEPYVMPGNTDGPESPTFGRAGWTWYTGAAAWLFRISTEWILGVRPTREGLLVDPCIPPAWKEFTITRRFRGTTYHIHVENPSHVSRGVREAWLDGRRLPTPLLPDLRDTQTHQVRVVLGAAQRNGVLQGGRRP